MTTLFMSDAQLNSLTALVYSNPFLKEDKHSPFREATSRWLTAKDPSDPSKTYCRHVKLRKLDLPHLTWLWVEYRRVWPPFLADGRTAARITTMRYDGESLSQWTVGWAVRYLVDYLGWMRRNESILVWRLKRVQAAGTDEAKQIADARAVVRERGAQTEALIRTSAPSPSSGWVGADSRRGVQVPRACSEQLRDQASCAAVGAMDGLDRPVRQRRGRGRQDVYEPARGRVREDHRADRLLPARAARDRGQWGAAPTRTIGFGAVLHRAQGRRDPEQLPAAGWALVVVWEGRN